MTSAQRFDATNAVYFDGDSPVPVAVSALEMRDQMLHISLDGNDDVLWPAHEVRRVLDSAGRGDASLRWTGDPLARLFTPNPFVFGALPDIDRAAPPKGRARLAAWAVGAVVAVAVQIFLLIPILADQLAGFIPPKGERALGEATLTQIQEVLARNDADLVPVCDGEDGIAALRKMEARLSTGLENETEFTVMVLDDPMINAFALPGGFIILFRGLIDAADTPGEVAAVFAHEMGHVVSRDPTRHALRSAGSIGVLGLLFGDFAGGAVVLFLAERLINAQYSQEAEAAADRFAIKTMVRAGIAPGGLAKFLDRMLREHGETDGIVAHFMSHPEFKERINSASAAVPPSGEFSAVLTDSEWSALRKICR